MKRLLTYLSAIIIMMMVPIGAQADKSKWLYLSSEIWGWNVITDNAMFEGDNNAEGNIYTKTISATDVNAHLTNNQFRFRLQACYGSKGNSSNNWRIYPTTNEQELTGSNTISFSEGGNSDNYCYFTPDQDAESYTLTFTYGSTRQIALTINKATTTPTVTFSPTSQSYSTDDLSVTLTSSNGNDIYYTTDGTTPTVSSSSHVSSGGTVTVTGTQTITAGVNNNGTLEGITSQTYTYVDPSTVGYYLVGDLNSFARPYTDTSWNTKKWTEYGAVNKVMQFHDNGDGTYSLRIPASRPSSDDSTWDKPVNEKGSGTSQFVIAPESAFSGTEYAGDLYTVGTDENWKTAWGLTLDWSQVLRPQSTTSLNNADIASGTMAASGSSNWSVYNNGGSYTITINPTAGTFSVTNDNTTHVMYVITKQDGYWRNSYLTDVTSDQNTAYNHRHGDNASKGELSEFPNLAGETVYIAHNWHEQGQNKNFTTNQHLNIFGAWNSNGDLAPVTWIAAKSGATAKSIFPTAGNYSTNIDPTTGRTDGVDGASQYSSVISSNNDPSTGNITGKKGDKALIDPDATLTPGTDGGNYNFDNYTTGTAETLTVTLSNATKYAYVIGANSSVTLDESSTKTNGSFTLTYDGTKVTDGFNNEVIGNTVYVKIQGQDDSSNKGTIHTYQYTFNVPSSTFYFTPKGGLFINSAKITVNGGTAPYTYTVKDASGNVRSTGKFVLDGNVDDDNYRISTPGILTVTDANGNTATSNELFDFTYSTSENYKNYNNNATVSKIIQTGGGQGALNVFINKNDDLNTLWLYAYNKTLDTEWKRDNGDPQNESTQKAKDAKQAKLDAVVRLTDKFPGNDLTKAPTITIDGIKYVHFTIPEGNLRDGDRVAIIVSQGNTPAENYWTQTKKEGVEIARDEDLAFMYNIINVPDGAGDDAGNNKGTNTLLPMAEDGSRTIFFTKPDNWTAPIYCHSMGPNNTETKWKATNEKMTVYDNNIYTYTVPNGMTKVMFVDANGNQTKDGGTDYNGGRIHYTWNGSTLNSTTATYAADLTELTTFLKTPPTTTVVTQRYPNGEDYWRAAPGDLSIKLDPTWGITGGLDDETSTRDWAGNVPKVVYTNQMPLTQTIQGLNAGKTYTVQAIVRGLGQNKKTVTLTLEGATTVSKTLNLRNGSGGNENSADLSRQGSEITRTGRVEYIEPLVFGSAGYKYKENDDNYKNLGSGWAKVEATVKASQAGWLTIKLQGDEWFDLSQVTLLEDANTDHGFRTTASATATSVDDLGSTGFDYRARDISSGWKKNNAYSFFDRGKNRNAVIFANDRTVIAMNPEHLADDPQNTELKAIDRRHPFNVVGSDEDDSNVGTAKALYLTDMGYGVDAENPVDYKIGDSTWPTYNSTNYRKSGYTFKPYLAFNAEDVILDRTPGVAEKKQTTIMLPFGITIDELKQYYGDDVQAWDYQSYDNTNRTITFKEEENALTANKPYILTGAYGILDSRGKGNGIKNVAAVVKTIHHTASDHSGFTGTYEYKLISRGDANETHYGYNPTTGKFQIAAKGGAALKPFRAYFTLPIPLDEQNAAPYFTVIFDDVSTGISTVEQAEVEDNNVYTISGMYVGKLGADKLHKGVYIVNGKKYVVK